MLRTIITASLLFFSIVIFAQTDSTRFVTYDVVNLVGGGILKGEIMSFDEATGGLVFKDLQGRIYSLSREEYDYFKENQAFPVKTKKDFVLKERKNNEFALQVGFDLNSITLVQYFDNNEYIRYGDDIRYIDMPFSLKIVGGKYLDNKSFAGITIEYALSADSKSIFSGGARYKYYYDSQKNNIGLYIPIELKYTSITGSTYFTTTDTTFFPDGGYSWPSDINVNSKFQAVTLSLGHGFAFMMSNKKQVAIEISARSYFGLKEEYVFEKEIIPDSKFNGVGVKAGISFEF